MVGACWPPERKFQAGLIPLSSNVCVACGASPCDDYHQFWGCSELANSVWPEVESTNYLVPRAASEVAALPCLWLRGLLPSDMCLEVPIPLPPLVDDIVICDPFSLTPDPDIWPAGLYGTDASGGRWGAYTP